MPPTELPFPSGGNIAPPPRRGWWLSRLSAGEWTGWHSLLALPGRQSWQASFPQTPPSRWAVCAATPSRWPAGILRPKSGTSGLPHCIPLGMSLAPAAHWQDGLRWTGTWCRAADKPCCAASWHGRPRLARPGMAADGGTDFWLFPTAREGSGRVGTQLPLQQAGRQAADLNLPPHLLGLSPPHLCVAQCSALLQERVLRKSPGGSVHSERLAPARAQQRLSCMALGVSPLQASPTGGSSWRPG